jgi:hypothetical protein
VAWNPKAERLAAASPDGTFWLWDTATGEQLLALRPTAVKSIIVGPTNSHAGALAWSPDGRQLGFFGQIVTVWDDMREGKE